jgi:hypothetical protein
MTRKDYDLIAEAIKDVGVFHDVGQSFKLMCPEDVLFSVAMELGRGLAADNPQFDRERFMVACGVAA